MPKSGLDITSAAGILRTASERGGWALCIGAGTSCTFDRSEAPFPLWGDLALSLARSVDPPLTKDHGISPDALISAAHNRLGSSPEEFAVRLAEALYEPMRARIGPTRWPAFARCLSERDPGALTRDAFESFLDVVESEYPTLTSLHLARVVNEVWHTKYRPASVLSFNAEPMFAALLNAFAVRGSAPGSSPTTSIDWITRSTSSRSTGRVPYHFCHGLLAVPGGRDRVSTRSEDKLVFREEEYLQLANLNHAWQSASFVSACTAHTVVFVGHSMTDPNVRRWLSWLHQTRLDDIDAMNGERPAGASPPSSSKHYWITRRNSETACDWVAASVAHLGLRVIWVDAWSEIPDLLRKML